MRTDYPPTQAHPCDAISKCWEHFQGWSPRVLEHHVDASKAAFLSHIDNANTITTSHDDDLFTFLFTTIELAQAIIDLRNKQWREMVRQPFNFPPPPKTISGNDLLTELGLGEPVQMLMFKEPTKPPALLAELGL